MKKRIMIFAICLFLSVFYSGLIFGSSGRPEADQRHGYDDRPRRSQMYSLQDDGTRA